MNDARCIDCLSADFRNVSSSVYENFAPVIEKKIAVVDLSKRWYNSQVKKAKRKLRRAEKIYIRHMTEFTKAEFVRLRREKDRIINHSKTQYVKGRINNCGSDSKKLQKELNNILGKILIPSLSFLNTKPKCN